MSKKKFGGHVFRSDDTDEDLNEYIDSPTDEPAEKPKQKWQSTYVKCYETHPALEIGGGTLIGGSCLSPVTANADVYIGFDYGMKVLKTKPWLGEKAPIQVHYEVTDMHAPKDAKDYIELVKWTVAQLEAGKIVHAGCIGGHGRTGMFFAAIYKLVTGEEDAITKVRELYCEKAVESKAQVNFLHDHFGIKKAEPAKAEWTSTKSYGGTYNASQYGGAANGKSWKSSGPQQLELSHMKKAAFSGATREWSAIKKAASSIFGQLL